LQQPRLPTLSNTAVALQAAQVAYDEVAWRTDVAMLAESWQWQAATNNYTAAKAQYRLYRGYCLSRATRRAALGHERRGDDCCRRLKPLIYPN